MVALHPTTTADVDTRKHMDLHLCDSSRGSWMHIPFCRLAHAHTAWPADEAASGAGGTMGSGAASVLLRPRPRGKDDERCTRTNEQRYRLRQQKFLL